MYNVHTMHSNNALMSKSCKDFKHSDTDLLANGSVSILVHVLKDLLERSLLAHKLSKGKTTIKVTIHSVKKF